jgi:hypothetical protein
MKQMIQQKEVIKTFKPEVQHDGEICGTVCVIVMDLKNKVLHITEETDALTSSWKAHSF